ncbi:GNAT family N-acetyltransferase [Flavobacteriaceae bacterium]|jgi:N-acetylglutamate synthase-like GNAT family acetyltransferase|nr:GNAT family N-acetyltransferase [Flavobacteriaceae bacterium]MDA7711149.1 GNAT family N-acetyltransferase [Flavobacteriaceae bacterium]MDA8993278.1 GNAT family N-acetyltransferase [Flavobacteriaceae bacterium]
MSINIRPFQKEDFRTIHQLISEAFNVSKDHPLQNSFLEQNHIHSFVAMENEIIVGTATLHLIYKTNRIMGLIEDVVIAPHAQGKGIGKALVLHLVEQSKSLGCYKTMLNAAAKNISFYEKMGLEVGEYQMVIRH